MEITPNALQCNGNFSVRFYSGAKGFLLDAGEARAIVTAEDFGISAAQVLLLGQA